MKKLASVVLSIFLLLLLNSVAFAGHRGGHHGGGHYVYHHHHHHRGYYHGGRWVYPFIGGVVAYGVIDRIINPPSPRYCPPPADPYQRAYEQEQARIQRERQLQWERDQYERGREDARRDSGYYQYGR